MRHIWQQSRGDYKNSYRLIMLNKIKNKKYYFFVAIVLFAVFFLISIFSYQDHENKKAEVAADREQSLSERLFSVSAEMPRVCFEKTCFDVEIADTIYKQQTGLMNRENLGKDKGMLFVFEKEEAHKFWMKNTLIPLDMIWIDGNSKIIYIQKNAQPCKAEPCETFGPDENAKYVLEINEGLAEEMGIEVGDELEIRNYNI
jgi:uncharacterized protein